MMGDNSELHIKLIENDIKELDATMAKLCIIDDEFALNILYEKREELKAKRYELLMKK